MQSKPSTRKSLSPGFTRPSFAKEPPSLMLLTWQ
jgi:hypothetical protein